MKNKFFSAIFTLSTLINLPVHADSTLFGGSQELQLIVNNRILAKVNGKAISVIDIMKKMDMQFYRQFPQYATSVQARYQFYQANWKYILEETIDRELILADSEETKLVVSAGDIREEMESMFGPNIIVNLDKIGLTYDEAYKMVLNDTIIRRMMYFRVQAKALNQVTPQVIRKYYDEVAKDNIRDNEWVYNVISLRYRDATRAAEMGNLVHHLLSEDKVPLVDLQEKFKEAAPKAPKQLTLSVSEEFHIKEKELAEAFKQVLLTLSPDSYSAPIAQKSRSDNSTVIRIFYLKNKILGGVVPFQELEPKIKEKLLDEAMTKETEVYMKKMRQHYDVQDEQLKLLMSTEFQPFSIQ